MISIFTKIEKIYKITKAMSVMGLGRMVSFSS